MDTPVLISHKTAWLVHHAPQNLVQSLARHDYQIGAQGISTQQRVARIRQALTDCGIPSDMLKTIDIAVVFEFERIRTKGVVCHILGQNLPYEHINELTPGIFITDEAFAFVLAAEWMDRIEYLEYGYEVCGDYRMRLNKYTHKVVLYISIALFISYFVLTSVPKFDTEENKIYFKSLYIISFVLLIIYSLLKNGKK